MLFQSAYHHRHLNTLFSTFNREFFITFASLVFPDLFYACVLKETWIPWHVSSFSLSGILYLLSLSFIFPVTLNTLCIMSNVLFPKFEV